MKARNTLPSTESSFVNLPFETDTPSVHVAPTHKFSENNFHLKCSCWSGSLVIGAKSAACCKHSNNHQPSSLLPSIRLDCAFAQVENKSQPYLYLREYVEFVHQTLALQCCVYTCMEHEPYVVLHEPYVVSNGWATFRRICCGSKRAILTANIRTFSQTRLLSVVPTEFYSCDIFTCKHTHALTNSTPHTKKGTCVIYAVPLL